MPGSPSRISVNVRQPSSMLRMISGVQRVAKISAARESGQKSP